MDLYFDLELGMGNYLKIAMADVYYQCLIMITRLRPCHSDRHGHYTVLQLFKSWKHIMQI